MLPNEEWASTQVELWWQELERSLSPSEIAALAPEAMRAGRSIGERLLRRAVDLAPENKSARNALIQFLVHAPRIVEAEEVAAEGARLDRHDVDSSLALARIQFGRGRFKQAAETMEALLRHEKENPQAWLEYARIARYSYELPPGTADQAFARAVDYAGEDFAVYQTAASYFLEQLNYAKAAQCFSLLAAAHPSALDELATCREYARSLTATGRASDAAGVIETALQRHRSVSPEKGTADWELAQRAEALLLHDAGRTDDEIAVLRSIRGAAGRTSADYARPEYLPSTPDRLGRLEEIVKGRDVVIFLQGPSFADFAALMNELVDVDFAAATLGTFPPVEEQLRRHLGRGTDLLTFTHPTTVRTWYAELQEFLTRPDHNLVLSTHYAVSSLQEQRSSAGEFVARHDQRLLFAYPAGGPPVPSRPLHFETCSTLSFMLPVIVLGRPKRVFLVGADGGAHPNFRRPYFYYDDIDAQGPVQDFLQRPDMLAYRNRPERLQEANRRLQIDAVHCDRFVLESFRFLEHVFGVPIPPVFNVCPHSAHQAFPRIDAVAAVAMLREGQA